MILKRKPADRSRWLWYFAKWLPRRMDDGTWIWREWYRARYVDGGGGMDIEWMWQRHLHLEEDW